MKVRPWTSGSKELLEHAVGHLAQDTAFDCRIAMISADNAVELAIRTFLGLPKGARGSDGPSRRRLEENGKVFPDLLDLLEEFGSNQLDDVSLGDLEGYHRLRNTLYTMAMVSLLIQCTLIATSKFKSPPAQLTRYFC